jgi:hypothetical protein
MLFLIVFIAIGQVMAKLFCIISSLFHNKSSLSNSKRPKSNKNNKTPKYNKDHKIF